ncbi:hypothetical protein VIOR3934_08079 [Vibrio orientalis CIP 102891 = ATCC 33934]|uniref:Uncharacterized protein n=1 Tax=Vibrio orientalis CIP 102891 = ATCC 33934 TaxID=675816 RepID=F9ST39_VIBOR|nr:hypothetical protein VIOR3934_08079 [Vibrio orientalis CIP 102891 = ATCC 33934]
MKSPVNILNHNYKYHIENKGLIEKFPTRLRSYNSFWGKGDLTKTAKVYPSLKLASVNRPALED